MTKLKDRVSYGAMAGWVLFATVLAPAQAVLAATGSDNTPPSSSTGTSTQTPGDNSTGTNQSPPTNGPSNNNAPTGSQGSNSGSSPQNGSAESSNSPASNTPSGSNNTGQGSPNNNSGSNPSGQNGTSGSPTSSTTQNNTGQNVTSGTGSNAQSGDVKAQGNMSSVGNSTSGNASAADTQVNTLNSTTNLTVAGSLQTFTFNINGNHVGDIVLSPGDFLQSSAATVVQSPENAETTTQTGSTITNTIDLSAISGNVTVQGNLGNVGDAMSGNAATELNLINMIESTVSDKQSFVGMVNINGNLKGNLLLPKSAIDELLPSPSQASQSINGSSSTTTTSNNLAVNNDVTLDASSGNVEVQGNGGSSGNISSGNGGTNLKLYNMTNEKIVGGNVLLVFVNVEGSWVGLLMNAPAGTTSAALGGGITEDSAIQNTATTNTNETINNNIKLSSQSGNVKVQGNTGSTGNAKSGNASANADVVNILGSQIDLSGWLGVMVINVYGGWQGSLEIQPVGTTIHVKAPPVHHTAQPKSNSGYGYSGATTESQNTQPLPNSKLVSTHTKTPSTHNTANFLVPANSKNSHSSNILSAAIVGAIGALLALTGGAAQILSHRRK